MRAKVAVTIDEELLEEVDRWVRDGQYPNRSRAIQAGLQRLREDRIKQTTLLRELARLDSAEERSMAEKGLVGEEWPEY